MADVDILSGASTDPGKRRSNNEDAVLEDPGRGLYIVADGMGGHACGEVAARIAAESITRSMERIPDTPYLRDPSLANRQRIFDWLAVAVEEANTAILQTAQGDSKYRGMGCTLEVVVVRGLSGFFAHVGDSRAYILRGGDLTLLTEDHTMAQVLLAAGQIKPEELATHPKRNVLMRSLGNLPKVQVDMFFLELVPGDRVLLCSDGLHNEVAPERLAAELGCADPRLAAKGLIQAALEGAARDNVTALVVAVADRPVRRSTTIGAVETRHALMGSPLFGLLTEGELMRAQRIALERVLAPGELVFSAGDPGDALYVVISGKLRVEQDGVGLGELGPGDHFGEMALIDDIPRSASVRAETATRLIGFPRVEFEGLLGSDPAITNKIQKRLLVSLSLRLRELNHQVAVYRKALHVGMRQG